MTNIDFSPEGVKVFAEKLTRAGKEMRVILDQLDRDVKEVEPHWGGDSQQQFQRFYRDWRKGMEMHLAAIKSSGSKLAEMAETFPKIQ
jgi:WXG100 family type VII secretion target